MNSCELTFAITALANAIAPNFNDDELSVLVAAATQLGDTLATIIVQRTLCENLKNKNQTGSSSNESSSSNNASTSDKYSNSHNTNT